MISKIKLPVITIALSLLLLVLHVKAIDGYLYLKIPFYDLITHFLGGVCIALFALYAFKKIKYIVPITIVVGLGWEVFEVYFGISGWPIDTLNYWIDTTKDMFVDTLGAVVVYITYKLND